MLRIVMTCKGEEQPRVQSGRTDKQKNDLMLLGNAKKSTGTTNAVT